MTTENRNMDYRPSSNVREYIDELLQNPELARQIAHHRLIPSSGFVHGESRQPWPAAIDKILGERGIRLFSHQALATDHIRAGRSVVVCTPTASGKSLIYNLPLYERFLSDPDARALYIFPLKALAQDQLKAFVRLGRAWPEEARPQAALYDGDTSTWERRKIRQNPPTALLTNPEMLHLSLLPWHESWATFLANLSFVVIDEAHTYRGIFGSHMAQIFRRLNRVCARYGANPIYIFCTATVGNPLELARNLSGKSDLKLIDQSGAPKASMHFLFADPEKAASTFAMELLKRALEKDLRVIVYCQSRKMTELVSMWAMSDSEQWRGKISAYRAGFLPEERRDIEARMANGDLRAVISTSALELGIDIGGLDLCILLGYPGTIMQTLQRSGRVGRSGREAAVIVVAGEDALDQYFARNPEDFFCRQPEKAVINPHNPAILERHLECGAAELPLHAREEWLEKQEVSAMVADLESKGVLVALPAGDSWVAAHKRPHGKIDLRGSGHSYSIEDQNGAVIGIIDAFRAWKETHPGAVYIHHGKNYLVDSLDDGRMRIIVREARLAWFTRIRSKKSTEIIEELDRKELGRCAVFRGRLKITEEISGYEKRSTSGNKLICVNPLDAPPQIFETDGLWFVFPDAIRKKLEEDCVHFMGSIHALEHAIIGLLPLEIVADRNDFGGISIPMHPQLGLPAVFIYDALPGGAGLTDAAFGEGLRILKSTYKAIAGCKCEDGCPSCIQSPKCGAGNRPLSKHGVIQLLEECFSPGTEGRKICEELKISPPLAAPVFPAKNDSRKPVNARPFLHGDKPKATSAPDYIVFDVETRRSARDVGGWDKACDMGVSVVVCYDSRDGAYHAYTQDELPALFEKFISGSLIIGFNSWRFDYKVLEPFWRESANCTGAQDLYSLPALDIFKCVHGKTGCRISLDNLGGATLQSSKSANGLQALRWWKEGRLDKIEEYCRKDVEITKNLYLYGREHGNLYYKNKAGMLVRVDVDFNV